MLSFAVKINNKNKFQKNHAHISLPEQLETRAHHPGDQY